MQVRHRQTFAERLQLPAEVLPQAARVTISGTSEVYVENHGGLSLLSAECVDIRSRTGTVRVSGRDLQLGFMNKTKIIVRGFIVTVEFI